MNGQCQLYFERIHKVLEAYRMKLPPANMFCQRIKEDGYRCNGQVQGLSPEFELLCGYHLWEKDDKEASEHTAREILQFCRAYDEELGDKATAQAIADYIAMNYHIKD